MRYTWVGHTLARPAGVYALAFTPRGQMLLVWANPEDLGWWLPGGGVEPGKTTQEALRREMREEADVLILTLNWGRSDPAAPILLARALEVERRHHIAAN